MKPITCSCVLISMAFCLTTFLVQGQNKAEKGVIKIDLAYHQLNDDLPVIKISAKTKKERKFEPVEGAAINIFFGAETSQGFIGRVKTNSHGAASLALPMRFKDQWDSLSSITFIGTLTQNDHFEDQSAELEISKAKIELVLEEIDSVRTMKATVLVLRDTGWVALPEAEIKLVVRRLLSDLPATEEESFTTDEHGIAQAEFNLSIPGDVKGDVIIEAKIDDHESYGNVVTSKVITWGVPVAPDQSFHKRTLWATRDKTPLWLLIFPNLIIVSVWGIIFYLIYQLARIIKLGKSNEPV
jgi:hypothetical protein